MTQKKLKELAKIIDTKTKEYEAQQGESFEPLQAIIHKGSSICAYFYDDVMADRPNLTQKEVDAIRITELLNTFKSESIVIEHKKRLRKIKKDLLSKYSKEEIAKALGLHTHAKYYARYTGYDEDYY